MTMLHPDDANDLAQRVTVFQSWLAPADLVTCRASPLNAPMRCTVRLTTYSQNRVSAVPVEIELLPLVQGKESMLLVIILDHPKL